MATDSQMLAALLEDERLSEDERPRFEDMERQLSNEGALSRKQHQYVESRWKQLGLNSDETLNLHSSGKCPKTLGSSKIVLPWEKPGYVKVLKPPGKK